MASTPPKVNTDEDDPRYRPCAKCGLCVITNGDASHCYYKHLPRRPKEKV